MTKTTSTHEKTTIKRRSRYQRDSQNPPRLYVTVRDQAILAAVGDYRFLSSDQVQALFFHSASTAKDRLAKLWQARFLERIYQPVLPTDGSPKALYALAREGAMLLAQRTGQDVSEFKHLTQKERRSTFFLDHTLCRNDFRIALTMACRRTRSLKLLAWRQKPEDLADCVRIPDKPGAEYHRVPLVADGYFEILAEGRKLAFLVEIDRGTTTCKRISRKLKGYYHWWQQDGPRTRFGVDNLRVLIVTTSDKRMEHLREVALDVREDRKGSRLFWLTTQGQVTLYEPWKVLAETWRTAAASNGTRHRLV
jgi:hypothetical protein